MRLTWDLGLFSAIATSAKEKQVIVNRVGTTFIVSPHICTYSDLHPLSF
jgi:hypothetical protein